MCCSTANISLPGNSQGQVQVCGLAPLGDLVFLFEPIRLLNAKGREKKKQQKNATIVCDLLIYTPVIYSWCYRWRYRWGVPKAAPRWASLQNVPHICAAAQEKKTQSAKSWREAPP